MTFSESVGKAIQDLTDDKSQAARYMFIIALVVMLNDNAVEYAPQVMYSIVGGFLVMMGAKSRD